MIKASSKTIKKGYPLAVFDIDGTIFRKNLQFELVNGLSFRGIFLKKDRSMLVQYYRDWLENKNSYERYRKLLVNLYQQRIKGCKKQEVQEVAKSVAAFHHGRLFIYTSKLFNKLKKTHFTLAISGSPNEIIREFNKYLKFDEVYGTKFEIDKNGYYTGKESFVPVRDKGFIVKEFLSQRGHKVKNSYGVGDTESDISFLSLVDNPIAFNPDLPLKKAAEENNWKIIVERKNVIYEI